MKICIISCFAIETPPRGYGGAEAQVHYLARGLAERRHKVLLVGAKGSYCEGAEVFEAIESAYRGLEIEEEAYKRYKDTVLSWKPDVILDHSHFFSTYRLKLQDPTLRVVKTWHDLQPAFSPPPKGSYDLMVGVSKFHTRFLEDKWGLPHGSIVPIYNGIDVEKFPFHEEKQDFLLYFSRIAEGKGALEAIKLAKRHRFKLVVAGEDSVEKGNDPAYVWACMKESDGGQIKYLGRVSEEEKMDLMCGAKAVIVPLLREHYQEVFGLWAVESMVCGTPVLTLKNGAMEELVKHGETGFIAETVEELPQYVEKLPEIKSSACREHVRNNFNLELMCKRYLDLCDKVVIMVIRRFGHGEVPSSATWGCSD